VGNFLGNTLRNKGEQALREGGTYCWDNLTVNNNKKSRFKTIRMTQKEICTSKMLKDFKGIVFRKMNGGLYTGLGRINYECKFMAT